MNVLAAAGAQMLLKKGAATSHASVVKEYLNPWVIGGYMIMGCTMLANIYAMSRGVDVKEVSIIESLSYIFVPIMSWIFFKEQLSIKKIFSIVVIIVGIVLFFL